MMNLHGAPDVDENGKMIPLANYGIKWRVVFWIRILE